MFNKKNVLEILKVGVVLFLITAISSGLLAYVNSITEPIIAENNRIKQETAMKTVLPEADNFSVKILPSLDMPTDVTELYKAQNGAGYVVMVSPLGYGGKISLVVGISDEDTVSGVSIVSQSETAGLGAKCTNESFLSQFTGKKEVINVVKNTPKENDITAISSATVTSKAVTKGVNSALEAVKMTKGEN